MGTFIIIGGYLFIAFFAYFVFYWLCAKEYSKREYVKRMYKFEEYLDKHSEIVMLSICWIFTLLVFIFRSLTYVIRKYIEKHFNIQD